MTDISQRLGWPSPKRTPNTDWIAERAGETSLYKYLYAASSRMIHFSAYEIYRRAWWNQIGDEDPSIDLNMPIYTHYRTDFALHWLPRLLIDTVRVASEIEARNDRDVKSEVNNDSFMDAVKTWVEEVGKIPIIRSEEFDLRPWQRLK